MVIVPFLRGNLITLLRGMIVPLQPHSGGPFWERRNDMKEASSVVNIGASLQDETPNHLSLNLSGDPISDLPDEVVLIDPHTAVAEAVNHIKKAVDMYLKRKNLLLVTGRVGLLPAFLAAAGEYVDDLRQNESLFGAVLLRPPSVHASRSV